MFYVTYDKNKAFLLKKLRSDGDYTSIVMGFNEFCKTFYFDYGIDALYYIVSKYHVNFSIAKIYLDSLMVIDGDYDNERLAFLKSLKDDLIANNLLKFNPYFANYLKKYKICFYHMILDNEVSKVLSLLSSYDVRFEKIALERNSLRVCSFSYMDDEVKSVCSKIGFLLKSGVDVSNIYLTNLNDDYRFLFKLYGKLFHLPFCFTKKIKVISTLIGKKFWENVLNCEDDVFKSLDKMVNSYEEQLVLDKLLNFYTQVSNIDCKDFIKAALSELSVSISYDDGICEFDFLKSEVNKDAYVFLVGANQGELPKVVKDDGLINGCMFSQLGFKDVSSINKLIYDETFNRLGYYDNIWVTYNTFNNYPSSLLDDFELVDEKIDINYEFSHLFNKVMYCKELDYYYLFGIVTDDLKRLNATYKDVNYLSYDNSFKSFAFESPKVLSYTALDDYFRCPFRYYLGHVLKLRDKSDTFKQKMGVFYHHILDRFYDADFDLAKEVSKYDISFTNARERFFFNKFVNWLSSVLDVIKYQDSFGEFKNVLREQEFKVLLLNGFSLKGFVDKIYNTLDAAFIVDYKTGQSDISLEYMRYGIGMQLPIYHYLLSKQGMLVGGFYLQSVGPSLFNCDFKHDVNSLFLKKMMLHGYSLLNEDVIKEFDKEYCNSNVIYALKVVSNGFSKFSKVLSSTNLKKMDLFVENILNDATNRMLENDYRIETKCIDNKLVGCLYCPYKDICHMQNKNVLYLAKERLDFLGGEEDEMVEESEPSYM